MAISVFVSYRRLDSAAYAGRLRDRLVHEFGETNVFFDVYSTEAGDDFPTVIRDRLQTSDAVLAVIGPRYDLERLAAAEDHVRLELLEAIRQEKFVIPVLVDNVTMPESGRFPEELRRLSWYHAAVLRPDPDFRPDADNIVQRLRRLVETGVDATAGHDRPHRRPVMAAVVGGLVALAIVAIAVVRLTGGDDETAATTVPAVTATATGSSTGSQTTVEAPVPTDVLESGSALQRGDVVTSPNGRHTLEVTADGRLVAATDGQEWWVANPEDPLPELYVAMQTDGNLVVYPSATQVGPGDALFASRTVGNPAAVLRVRDDGVVAVHGLDGSELARAPFDPPEAPEEPADTSAPTSTDTSIATTISAPTSTVLDSTTVPSNT